MNDTTQLVPLCKQSINIYAKATRQLRRKVGRKAPTTVELINFELSGRDPRDIASCFLEHLRDLDRRRQIEPGIRRTRRGPGAASVALTRPAAWPGRRTLAAMPDPTRN